jgi:hypothetical protein
LEVADGIATSRRGHSDYSSPSETSGSPSAAASTGTRSRIKRWIGRELVGPGGKATFAAIIAQLGEHRDQSVVGALVGEVVEVIAAKVPQGGATATHLEARRAEQQGMEIPDSLLAGRTPTVQPGQPVA